MSDTSTSVAASISSAPASSASPMFSRTPPSPEEAIRLANLAYERHLEERSLLSRMTKLNISPNSREENQVYLVCVYMLMDRPIDHTHGGFYPISVHKSEKEAHKRAKEYIDEHEIDHVKIFAMRQWNPLMDRNGTNQHHIVKYVEQMEQDEYQKQLERHRKLMAESKQLDEDLQKQRTVGTIEHYAVTTVQVCRREAEIAKAKMHLDDLIKRQDGDIEMLSKIHTEHPEYEEKTGTFDEESWIGAAKRIMYPHGGKNVLDGVTLVWEELKNKWLTH